VPHKGWVCDRIVDTESATSICEMCEVTTIRFVHFMQHPEYPDELRCGCICAGHMEGDLVAAQNRESALKRCNRRVASGMRAVWKISSRGNPYWRNGFCIMTVFRKNDAWSGSVKDRSDSKFTWFLKDTFPSDADAKRAVLKVASALIDKRDRPKEVK
jgi:hypothetical protein